MDQMENFQTIIRFKKLEPNLNNHTSSIEGVADDSQAAQNPSDTSNQSVDDLIKPLPAMIIEDDEESRKFELTISDRNKSLSEDDENEDMIKVKPPRPPRKKVRETLKEPLYEEDIIEGFSFVSFKTYDDLERMTAWSSQHNGKFPDPYSKLKLDHEKIKEKKKKKKKEKQNQPSEEKIANKQHDSNAKTGSSGSSSEKGYICDSDSDGEKNSENGFFGPRKENYRNGHLSRPPSGVLMSSNQIIKTENSSSASEQLTTTPMTGAPVVTSAGVLSPTPLFSATTTTAATATGATTSTPTSNANPTPRGLYRPYSTSPPPTPKKQAPPLSSPVSVGSFSTQSFSHPLSSTGVPQYSPVPYYPDDKDSVGRLSIKSEDSLRFPAVSGSSLISPSSSLKVKSSSSLMDSQTSETSAMHQPHHPLRLSQNFNKLPSGPMGMDPYSALRGPMQSTSSSIGSMPPPQSRPIQSGGSSLQLPESSPQSDWLRRDLDSRFLSNQDRAAVAAARGLTSPFLPSNQQSLGPPGSLMRPVMPPPPGASFLAASLDGPKIGLPGPGYPGLSPLASPLSLRPNGSFVAPTFQANLTPKKTGKWNAMHVRIAWEIYNHQHKNTDPSKSQPSSLNPSSSAIRDSNSRILSNELTKKPNLESDKSKFAPPVISRTGERPNPFGVENRIQNSMPKTSLASSLESLSSNYPGLLPISSSSSTTFSSMGSHASTTTTNSLPSTMPSFGGLGAIHDSLAPPGLIPGFPPPQGPPPPSSMAMSMSNDPFGLNRSVFSSAANHINRSHEFMIQNRLMEDRDREKREQRKKNDDLLSGKRSPLIHSSIHRSPMPEKSPLSAPGSSPVSPLVTSKREDRPSSVNTNASGSSSHLSRHQSDSDDGGKNEVTYVGERRSTNPMPARPSNTMKTNVPSSMTGMVSTAGLVPGTFRPPMASSTPFPGYGLPPHSPFMDPRTMALYGSMMPPMPSATQNPFYPGFDPFRDPYRGLNPFLKDQLAERELLSRFNTLIASEQDRQRMAAMSAAYPPGFFPPTSAAAYLGSQAAAAAAVAGLGSKLPQPPPHLAAMYPGIPGLGAQGLGNPGLGGSLGAPGLGPSALGAPGMGMPGMGPASLGAPSLGAPGLGGPSLGHQIPSSQP